MNAKGIMRLALWCTLSATLLSCVNDDTDECPGLSLHFNYAHRLDPQQAEFPTRIEDVRVRCEADPEREGVLLIRVSYVVRSTNNPYNLVYPFYLNSSDESELLRNPVN